MRDIGFLECAISRHVTRRGVRTMQFGIFDLSLGEIMAYFQDPWVLGWLLIGSGALAAIWLLENLTDPIPLLGSLVDVFVAIGSYLGFIVGIVDILAGYVVYTTYPGAGIVALVLVVIGFSLVMRLLSKFPIAILFAIGLSAFATFTIYGLVQPYTSKAGFPIEQVTAITDQIVSLKVMIVIFIIIFCVVYMIGGLIIKLIQLIGRIFSSTPVSIFLGLIAMAVGVIVVLIASGVIQLDLISFAVTTT